MEKVQQLGLIEDLNDKLGVDNLEKVIAEGRTSKVTSIKPKVITISVDEDWVENNLIDMPFIYYYKAKETINTLEFRWFSNDGLERAIKVTSMKGIPSSFEYDVLLALLRIYFKSNDNKLIIGKEMDNKIQFTFRELAREMGYKSFSSKIKDKLDKAIEILDATKIYNTAKGGIYNPVTKEYITNPKKSISLINSYSSYSYTVGEDKRKHVSQEALKDKSSVVIDNFLLESIIHGKGKLSDKSLRLSLQNDLSRRIYLIINKWRNKRNSMFVTYEKLYERIPLIDTKTSKYRNRRIKDACAELKEKGFLEEFEWDRKGITFIFKNKKSSPDYTAEELKACSSKYKTYEEIMEGLNKYGFDSNEINKYVTFDKFQLCQAILRYIDVHRNVIESPKHYIIGALLKNDERILENPLYSEVAIGKE